MVWGTNEPPERWGSFRLLLYCPGGEIHQWNYFWTGRVKVTAQVSAPCTRLLTTFFTPVHKAPHAFRVVVSRNRNALPPSTTAVAVLIYDFRVVAAGCSGPFLLKPEAELLLIATRMTSVPGSFGYLKLYKYLDGKYRQARTWITFSSGVTARQMVSWILWYASLWHLCRKRCFIYKQELLKATEVLLWDYSLECWVFPSPCRPCPQEKAQMELSLLETQFSSLSWKKEKHNF